MADVPPSPRHMSLIPYPNANQEIVLRRGDLEVIFDNSSQQLQVRNASEQAIELTECPYCHRPYREEEPTSSNNDAGHASTRPFHPERPFVDPDYFGMLAASQRASPNTSGTTTPTRRFFPAVLRSGRSRDVSGAHGPPSGAEFIGSAPSASTAEGISSTAFSPGFFQQFFVEQGILGRGGYGVVMLVEHILDRVSLGQFACKRVPVGNNHQWLEKVLIEVKLLQKIPHRNLVQYHWVWLEDHQPTTFGPKIPCLFILQEYCNGGDLHNYVLGPQDEVSATQALKEQLRRKSKGSPEPPQGLNTATRLTFDEILSFFKDITSGLHHLHSKGYIHRDLKPSNCLLQRDGTKTRVLISDFGEVQAAGVRRGNTGATGTISYCAPEVLRRDRPEGAFGDFTTKSDIFSLGMIVYFMCFGRLPYIHADGIDENSEDLDALRSEITKWQGFNDEARSRSDLPEKLYKFLKRLLSVDPNERPSTGDILESIRGGGNLADATMDEASPRISTADTPTPNRLQAHGRRPSTHIGRPGLSSLSRRHTGAVTRSLSPVKHASDRESEGTSRPMSPVNGTVAVRPRKIDMPAPTDSMPPPHQSPRLMLPPAPDQVPAYGIPRRLQSPAAISGFRASLFVVKLLVFSLPCAPYAANAWLLYPLLGLASLDIGILDFELRRSLALLAVHLAAAWLAWQRGGLCDVPLIRWNDV
ncbi:kinase-like protein [Hortaea werneckii]|nr:kinase-like protein [Hortaea werneckii]